MMLKAIKKTASFLGLRQSMIGLLGMVVLVGMGEKMAERFLPIYLLAVGGGALSIGLLNGLDNLLSALYSFPGGYLSDRLGVKRALLIFNLMAMAGFIIVILIPIWTAVILGSVLFLSWTAISLPASMSLVAKVLPKEAHHGRVYALSSQAGAYGPGTRGRRAVHKSVGRAQRCTYGLCGSAYHGRRRRDHTAKDDNR